MKYYKVVNIGYRGNRTIYRSAIAGRTGSLGTSVEYMLNEHVHAKPSKLFVFTNIETARDWEAGLCSTSRIFEVEVTNPVQPPARIPNLNYVDPNIWWVDGVLSNGFDNDYGSCGWPTPINTMMVDSVKLIREIE
jgi:hypothetical protein